MILAVCDKNFLYKAKTLIRSCAKHEPDQRFYLFLINSESPTNRVFQSWHPNIIIERVWWQYDPVNWQAKMSSARSIPLEKVLEKYREKIIYLDTDIIVRGPLVEIFSSLNEYDLTVKLRPQLNQRGPAGTEYAAKFNAGVIGIRPSSVGLKFTRKYNQLIQEHIASGNPLKYYLEEEKIMSWIDQELLFVTYIQFQKELRFKSLPEKYNDSRFHTNSVIWHGKGTAYQHPQFTIERMRYDFPMFYNPLGVINKFLSFVRKLKRYLTIANQIV